MSNESQPQRSEPQEWTPEYVAGLMARSPTLRRQDELLRGYKVVSNAHNATLATERQRREQAVKGCRSMVTEQRQIITELEQQLLSTQAAIETCIDWLEDRFSEAEPMGSGDEPCSVNLANGLIAQLKSIDLSLLRQHDAEVRKPLVELLRSVHTWFMQQAPHHYNGCGLWIDVDATLAEHPRENCILDVDSPTLPPEREEYLQCGCSNCRDALAKAKEGK